MNTLLGRFCLSFNCSAQNSVEQLESLIIGTFLAGTTLCLDEFNRLSLETMSTSINHILGIYQAKHSHNLSYYMHGLELSVNPLSAFFLSQNPNYVGRSSLPSNTSSIAKIIDVPTADFEAIAEEYFLLASFNSPKNCSMQLNNIFKQCSAIVSPMRHYDFSLRTLLANVKNAIWLQNENPALSEMGVTVKAALNLLSSMFTVVVGVFQP
uniref:Dynein heavy chain hydrolytic ATP-binding dynein motor region domain-containing protein n=1 Tax=Panagrolaimus davidi TaxID=227884 RepID=A0A914P454_9BILA